MTQRRLFFLNLGTGNTKRSPGGLLDGTLRGSGWLADQQLAIGIVLDDVVQDPGFMWRNHTPVQEEQDAMTVADVGLSPSGRSK